MPGCCDLARFAINPLPVVKRNPDLTCITRIDIETPSRTHGWEVRVRRRHLPVSEFFSDSRHGGKRKALAAAKEFRDWIVAEHPKMPRSERAQMVMETNTSGIPGVRRAVKKISRGGKEYHYEVWTAEGTPRPGTRKTRDFYISKLGEEDALDAAIAQRAEWLVELEEWERQHPENI